MERNLGAESMRMGVVSMNPGVIVPGLIFGPIVIILGLYIVRNRVRVNRSVYRAQQTFVGKRAANASAGKQSPWMMGVVGIGFVAFGTMFLSAAVMALTQL